jgi:uracil-DNA glycosylase
MREVPPASVFLTNAFIGLLDAGGFGTRYPRNATFVAKCSEFLRTELDLLRPRVVVCLGGEASRLLAEITEGLDHWRTWPGFDSIIEGDAQLVSGCSVPSLDHRYQYTAVTVRHPSAVLTREARMADATAIAKAVQAAG